MQGEQFLEAYERAPEPESPENNFSRIVYPLELAAHRLGEWTYTFLEQPPKPDRELTGIATLPPTEDKIPTFDKDFIGYLDWQVENRHIPNELHQLRGETLQNIKAALEGGHISQEEADELTFETITDHEEALRKITFHLLTASMAPMWKPLLDGQWPKPGPNDRDKFWWITRAQRDIAGNAMDSLRVRSRLAKAEGNMNYFSQPLSNLRSIQEGAGTEFDIAIKLLEIVKQAMHEDPELELTVIPAPPQFEAADFRRLAAERNYEPKNPNVDFLVINLRTHEVVGVQAKARRRAKVARRYDDKRVIMQYGSPDLGNTVRVKLPPKAEADPTHRVTPTEQVFSWSGALSVAMAAKLPTHGPETALVDHRRHKVGYSRGGQKQTAPLQRLGPDPISFEKLIG